MSMEKKYCPMSGKEILPDGKCFCVIHQGKQICDLLSGNKKCEPNGIIYTSLPPKNKCKHCCLFWAIGEDVPICENPLPENYSQPTVKVQESSVNPTEDKGVHICYGSKYNYDEKMHYCECGKSVPNGVQETTNTNAIKASGEKIIENCLKCAPIAEAIVFGVQEPWEEQLRKRASTPGDYFTEQQVIPVDIAIVFIKALLQEESMKYTDESFLKSIENKAKAEVLRDVMKKTYTLLSPGEGVTYISSDKIEDYAKEKNISLESEE